jgi:hypothetical protein
LKFTSTGWATLFLQQLKQFNQLGVVGPYDPMHGGRLLTQAFVSRKHYDIFGRFFAIDIKVDALIICGLSLIS